MAVKVKHDTPGSQIRIGISVQQKLKIRYQIPHEELSFFAEENADNFVQGGTDFAQFTPICTARREERDRSAIAVRARRQFSSWLQQ